MEIKLNRLARAIGQCWAEAESELIQLIAEKHPNPPEELITELLAGGLRTAVRRASNNRRIEQAFLDDLASEFPGISNRDVQRFAGLIASVTPHNKSHEGKVSGADLGVVVLRPQIQVHGWGRKTVECNRDHATGLLAQAKLGHHKKRRKGYSWRKLQKAQEELYPSRQSYYSLLLYRLKGQRFSEFDSVRWQLCADNNIEEVIGWLRSDSFPKETASPELVKMLFDRQIGTHDTSIIDSIIAPNHQDPRVIEVRISWPDGSGPPPHFHLQNDQQQQHEGQHIRQSR